MPFLEAKDSDMILYTGIFLETYSYHWLLAEALSIATSVSSSSDCDVFCLRTVVVPPFTKSAEFIFAFVIGNAFAFNGVGGISWSNAWG